MTANAIEYNEMFMPTPSGFRDALNGLRRILSEEGVIDFVAKLSPWLAPLPSAFFVYQATMDHLTTWPALAVTIAIVIETLGLTTTHTALGMHAWNQTHKEQPEKQAPFVLALILALVYVVATLLLIGVLEVLPDLEHYAPAMFPLLAVVGAVNLALRSHHNTRIREEKQQASDSRLRQRQLEDEERALKHEERRIKTAAKYGMTVASSVTRSGTLAVASLSDTSIVTPNSTLDATDSRLDMSQRQAAIAEYLRNNDNPGASALGRMFGVDRKTIYRDLEALKG
jgi:hypothetical protein